MKQYCSFGVCYAYLPSIRKQFITNNFTFYITTFNIKLILLAKGISYLIIIEIKSTYFIQKLFVFEHVKRLFKSIYFLSNQLL